MVTTESLNDLRKEAEQCTRCSLWKTRHSVVFGDGTPDASIMFIGEAPGKNEDLQGRPFVGRAGAIFESLLTSIGVSRANVYICNILKCRPPGNRNPQPIEIKTCTPFLDKQIAVIQPKIIGMLGNFASAYILEKYGIPPKPIGVIHGKIFRIKSLTFETMLIPLYHPAAAIYNPALKNLLFEDCKKINSYLKTI
jgi:uracil-DNA glycosylase family 4